MLDITDDQIQKLKNSPIVVTLVSVELKNQTYYFNDTDHSIRYGGIVYNGGLMREIEAVSSRLTPSADEISIIFDAVDQSFLSAVLNDKPFFSPLTIKRVFFESEPSGLPLVTREFWSTTLYEGVITDYEVEENRRGASVELSVQSIWADFESIAGRKTNNPNNQRFYPDDYGYELTPKIIELPWGRQGEVN